jgi:hypothetical protein
MGLFNRDIVRLPVKCVRDVTVDVKLCLVYFIMHPSQWPREMNTEDNNLNAHTCHLTR